MMGEVHLLPGTTFSSVKERGDYKSARHASLTMRELEQWLTLQIVQVYHQRVHPSIGMPPLAAWTKSITESREALRRPTYPDRFYIDFLPGEFRLIRRDGIQILSIHYWDSTLSPVAGRSKDKYMVRYDPRDLSHVYVKDRTGRQYLKVPYRNMRHPPIALGEHRSVVKRLGQNKNLAINEANLFDAVLEQRVIVNRARKQTATARRDREKRAFHKTSSIFGENHPRTGSSSGALLESVSPYKVEVWE